MKLNEHFRLELHVCIVFIQYKKKRKLNEIE